ncbi:MAG: cell division protein FtsX [Hyphomicrobiaceae bacterium]
MAMSASYDDPRTLRPHANPNEQTSGRSLTHALSENATRGGPPDRGDPPTQTHRPEPNPHHDELVATARAASDGPKNTPSSSAGIVPPGSVTGSSLTLVITIMCFLACLTAGAVYMINQSAAAWTRNIASEVTVQLQPLEGINMDKRMTEVALFLAKIPGIRQVNPLSSDVATELLEPWLGQSGALESLPVPRLIALEVDRRNPPDLDKLGDSLSRRYPGASLDDHRQWQSQIRAVTRSLALGGLAILVLVGAATTAIIVSATRSSMASNREIVEVLHFVGATDRFIAREFERHFLNLGIRAGLVGAVCAMGVFFLMPTAMRMLGGGDVTASELRRLIGTGSLDLPGYFLLGIVVVVIAGLCMLTSRYGVFRILHSRN